MRCAKLRMSAGRRHRPRAGAKEAPHEPAARTKFGSDATWRSDRNPPRRTINRGDDRYRPIRVAADLKCWTPAHETHRLTTPRTQRCGFRAQGEPLRHGFDAVGHRRAG